MANATSGTAFAEGLFTGVGVGMAACAACVCLARAMRGPVRMMRLGYALEADKLNAPLLADLGGAAARAADLGGAAAPAAPAALASPAAPA